MRHVLYSAVFAPLLTAGCMSAQHSHCGFELRIIKPPTIETSQMAVVSPGSTTTGVLPMGNTFGPLSAGSYDHAPLIMGGMPAASFVTAPVRPLAAQASDPCGAAPTSLLSRRPASALAGPDCTLQDACQRIADLERKLANRPLPAGEVLPMPRAKEE